MCIKRIQRRVSQQALGPLQPLPPAEGLPALRAPPLQMLQGGDSAAHNGGRYHSRKIFSPKQPRTNQPRTPEGARNLTKVSALTA